MQILKIKPNSTTTNKIINKITKIISKMTAIIKNNLWFIMMNVETNNTNNPHINIRIKDKISNHNMPTNINKTKTTRLNQTFLLHYNQFNKTKRLTWKIKAIFSTRSPILTKLNHKLGTNKLLTPEITFSEMITSLKTIFPTRSLTNLREYKTKLKSKIKLVKCKMTFFWEISKEKLMIKNKNMNNT